jgi:hypothetical protein
MSTERQAGQLSQIFYPGTEIVSPPLVARSVGVDAPELFLEPRADPTFGLITGPPSLPVVAANADKGEC